MVARNNATNVQVMLEAKKIQKSLSENERDKTVNAHKFELKFECPMQIIDLMDNLKLTNTVNCKTVETNLSLSILQLRAFDVSVNRVFGYRSIQGDNWFK